MQRRVVVLALVPAREDDLQWFPIFLRFTLSAGVSLSLADGSELLFIEIMESSRMRRWIPLGPGSSSSITVDVDAADLYQKRNRETYRFF